MKKYGRKWRQNNPGEAKKIRDNPNYFKEKRELARNRKQELAEKVVEKPIEHFDEAELVIEPQKKKSWKEISTGPMVWAGSASSYLDELEKD